MPQKNLLSLPFFNSIITFLEKKQIIEKLFESEYTCKSWLR